MQNNSLTSSEVIESILSFLGHSSSLVYAVIIVSKRNLSIGIQNKKKKNIIQKIYSFLKLLDSVFLNYV